MTEFPRFAMGDSAAVAGNVPANPAICGAFPSASGRKTKPCKSRRLHSASPYQRLLSG
jgi:hypothetical protein